ncbi:MAG: hypothetical protein ING84_18820 [Cytophagales bacterium]|nr:hypothetical protein [Cytophagales bacterium]MCA6369061.1 hypothetical protein [Cytophagales bacterium]MCA6373506.1 hypothetical protein [Cytophagales bacterium]MCA6375491.1 hypothetical protein [Cytophagales bacterium]MCA6385357.1 hypothetical protein [Cytophagales bacterium]
MQSYRFDFLFLIDAIQHIFNAEKSFSRKFFTSYHATEKKITKLRLIKIIGNNRALLKNFGRRE